LYIIDKRLLHLQPKSFEENVNLFVAIALARILITPFEIVKRKMQADKEISSATTRDGLLGTFKQIYKEEGLPGLFKGWALGIMEVYAVIIIEFGVRTMIESLGQSDQVEEEIDQPVRKRATPGRRLVEYPNLNPIPPFPIEQVFRS